MFRALTSLLMRPRHIMFTPPPLSRRMGRFKCKVCQHSWVSRDVWVTKTTERAYQGESCERCGTTAKPFHIRLPNEATIFNRVPAPSLSPKLKGKTAGKRFDWRIGKGRR